MPTLSINGQPITFPETVKCPSCDKGWMGALRCLRCDGRGNSQQHVINHYASQCAHRYRALATEQVRFGVYRHGYECTRCGVVIKVESDD